MSRPKPLFTPVMNHILWAITSFLSAFALSKGQS